MPSFWRLFYLFLFIFFHLEYAQYRREVLRIRSLAGKIKRYYLLIRTGRSKRQLHVWSHSRGDLSEMVLGFCMDSRDSCDLGDHTQLRAMRKRVLLGAAIASISFLMASSPRSHAPESISSSLRTSERVWTSWGCGVSRLSQIEFGKPKQRFEHYGNTRPHGFLLDRRTMVHSYILHSSCV